MTKFRDLAVGDRFDWVDDAHSAATLNSFFDRCEKVSARCYRSLDTDLRYRVGTIDAPVHHVTAA